nr:invasion associated locus B family protein [Mesorhizobium loti]
MRPIVVAVALMATASVIDAAPLPGGSSSLMETYDDWSVVCQVRSDVTSCAARQVQTSKQTNQTVLAIEILGTAKDKLSGFLLLPLGLALAEGARFKIDDGAAEAAVAFTTCLPQGCVVPLDLGADVTARLRVGKTLTINIVATDTAKPLALPVSLKGFANALDRVSDLTK